MAAVIAKEVPIELVQFLVVDDHSFVRHLVSECLKSNSISRIAFAQNGSEALHLLKMATKTADGTLLDMIGARPDIASDLFPQTATFKASHGHCVITDFKMDDINGLHILKAIRCGETHLPTNTPVILLTGFSDDFVVSVALQLDVNAFVVKPVSNKALWEKIQRVLKSVSQVKESSAYDSIGIPDEEGVIEADTDMASNPDLLAENEDDVRRLPLSALSPGAVLARDLYGARGVLLLRAGTELTESVIHRLADLNQMKGLAGDIPVKRMADA